MATAVDFEGTNIQLNPPNGRDDVAPLRAFTNGNCVVSCWELSDEEFETIRRTRKVFVSQFSGNTIYPTFIGDATSVRDVVSGYGKTIPQQPGGRERNNRVDLSEVQKKGAAGNAARAEQTANEIAAIIADLKDPFAAADVVKILNSRRILSGRGLPWTVPGIRRSLRRAKEINKLRSASTVGGPT